MHADSTDRDAPATVGGANVVRRYRAGVGRQSAGLPDRRWIATGTAYTLLGLPAALALGLAAALLEAVPIVGPILGAIPAVFVAATVRPDLVLTVAGVYLVVQLAESNIVVPMVMRNNVGLSPFMAVISLLVGGTLGGMFGAFIAVPVAASVEIVLEYLQARAEPVGLEAAGTPEPDVVAPRPRAVTPSARERSADEPETDMSLQRPDRQAVRGRAGCAAIIAVPTMQESEMAKNRSHEIPVGENEDRPGIDAVADTIVERGRAVLDHIPDAAAGVRGALAGAEAQVNGLSDMGVVAASGFALGVTTGLLLAGAPRVVIAAAAVAVVLTLRSAMTRGVRPARLVN